MIDGALRRTRTTKWGIGNRILSTTDSLTGNYTYTHDNFGNLVHSANSLFEEVVRAPDTIGNLFKENDRSDRTYGKAGQLLTMKTDRGETKFDYDPEGNLIKKSEQNGQIWKYDWNGSGMMSSVTRPDGKIVEFTYDPLGRRLSKTFGDKTTRWGWDGNYPVHELTVVQKTESPVVSWLFGEGSFSPTAKLVGDKSFDIVTDHLGTPVGMYDSRGMLVWNQELDIWGKVKTGSTTVLTESCPFRFPGQYEDDETGLYYNRFRYFDPEVSGYISMDPIGLTGGNPTLYGYVGNPMGMFDYFGLAKDCTGGRHKDTQYPTNDKKDSHHMPSKDAYKGTALTPNEGTAIKMDPDDHKNTASNGSGKKACEYREKQRALIQQGKFDDAMQMDIDDIQSKFGDKYDAEILEMIDSIDKDLYKNVMILI